MKKRGRPIRIKHPKHRRLPQAPRAEAKAFLVGMAGDLLIIQRRNPWPLPSAVRLRFPLDDMDCVLVRLALDHLEVLGRVRGKFKRLRHAIPLTAVTLNNLRSAVGVLSG